MGARFQIWSDFRSTGLSLVTRKFLKSLQMHQEKRKQDESRAIKETSKLARLAHEASVCPILQGLPVVPVIAEDGHIYEKEAIEKWLLKTASRLSPENPWVGAWSGRLQRSK